MTQGALDFFKPSAYMEEVRNSLLLASFLLLQANGTLPPQQPEPAVLHAYVNAVQIPVLVLDRLAQRAAPVPEADFFVSLDGGRIFTPTHVRREGEDPIRLVIFLDEGERTAGTLPELPAAMSQLWPESLKSQDVVSFAMRVKCKLFWSQPFPASAAGLKQVSQKLPHIGEEFATTGKTGQPLCADGRSLWDSVGFALDQFEGSKARRVILVLTDGPDESRDKHWKPLMALANTRGVSIFAIRRRDERSARKQTILIQRDAFAFRALQSRDSMDTLSAVTELTGGIAVESRWHPLAESLSRVMRLVRERYIIEFPRSSDLGKGSHSIVVGIRGGQQMIWPAGLGVPLPDPGQENDPHRVPNSPGLQPPTGKRKILK